MKSEIIMIPRPALTNMNAANDIKNIITELTDEWFSDDVIDDIGLDLRFHDSLCLLQDGHVVSFINYTSFDGSLRISLMATKKGLRGKGYGSSLLTHLFNTTIEYGIGRIDLLTVPPHTNALYNETVGFYIKHGFKVKQEYPEYWENGALHLERYI
ncbi:GNAT family N-acetyltransferase [Paenibacillus xylaniclasticus]|uniref:GNAT family N-acetyltransferase n=1 Tax=Paenibacillus xylaniclasticus TaxID=588083 RepID=UPI000FD82B5B|nr:MULTISPECIES: GNAT family N-acetyltransferase [Paenibacillus]GFN33978.1 hypothetical protein PCURB6_42380 [Paenibacillus curdlanolyticus]